MIRVEHSEANIRCTMVLLMSQCGAGVIPVPLAVQMAPASLLNEAWRAAAINHLNGHTSVKEEQKRKDKESGVFEELHEELNWEERRERAG